MTCEGCGKKLYRDRKNGVLAGVCAGIADYLSVDVKWVRIGAFFAFLVFTVVTACLYICGALFLDEKPAHLYEDKEDETYWRHYRRSPRNTMAETRRRFRKLEQRLRRAESYMTSKRYNLDREFENLK